MRASRRRQRSKSDRRSLLDSPRIMEEAASALAAERKHSALGWASLVAAGVACLAIGWFLARWVPAGHRGTLWGGRLMPWAVGLALAAGVAYLAPPAWIDRRLAARERRPATWALLVLFFAIQFVIAYCRRGRAEMTS